VLKEERREGEEREMYIANSIETRRRRRGRLERITKPFV